MHGCLLAMKVFVCFLRGDFLQGSSGLCFSLPKLMLENSSHCLGGKEIKGNYYACDEHMKHFVKARQVCGKGRELPQTRQGWAHSSSEGLCECSDPIESKCVIQDESSPLLQGSLLPAWRNCPGALWESQGD